jgi:Fic family protein
MSNKVDDLIEQKIEEKLGLYDTSSPRRSDNEIRDSIQEELEKRPKNSHELQNAINATKSTVENHCEHLKDLDVVEKIEIQDQDYWRLKD